MKVLNENLCKTQCMKGQIQIFYNEKRESLDCQTCMCAQMFLWWRYPNICIYVWRQFANICIYMYEDDFLIFVYICMKAISYYLYIFVWRQFPNICVYLYEGEFCGKWTILNIETGGQPGAASKSNAILQCEFIQITSTVSVMHKNNIQDLPH